MALSSRHTGRRILGHDIIGSVREAGAMLARLQKSGNLPDLMIITSPDLTGDSLSALLAAANRHGVRVMRTPNLTALSPADDGSLQLQPIALEDLLNRRQVTLDCEGMAALIRGRRVMVTGAGGSIGSELARQVAGFDPAELMLLDNGEFALWQIDLELSDLAPRTKRRAVIADVRDAGRMHALCQGIPGRSWSFNAAALKHVPIVEANPLEGLQTNAIGHPRRRRCGAVQRRCADGAGFHRQGGQSQLRHGRFQAAGGNVLPRAGCGFPPRRLADALRDRAVRQCSRLHRFGGSLVPAAAGAWRPADRDASGHAALFHDRAGGGEPGPAGLGRRQRRGRDRGWRHLCAGYGPSR